MRTIRASELGRVRRTDAAASDLARSNTTNFVALLLVQDIIWFVINRVMMSASWSFYSISKFGLLNFALYVVIAIAMWGFAVFFCRHVKDFRKFRFPLIAVRALILVAIVTNIYMPAFVEANARYVSGGLVGLSGIIYNISRVLSLCSMILIVRQRYNQDPSFSWTWTGAFCVSYGLSIDGLAPAMTLSAFLMLLIKDLKLKNVLFGAIGGLGVALTMVIGFNQKFNELPYYMTPTFFVQWVLARLAIAGEQGYRYISGESLLNSDGQYINLILRSVENRIDIISGKFPILTFPRSVSEALYYDMYGYFDAGSSPGFLLGLILNNVISIPILFLYCTIFFQMFSGVNFRFRVIHLFLLALITKTIYTNTSEYFVVIAPALVTLIFFLITCNIRISEGKVSRDVRRN